jgi:hypothetical protein
MKDEIVQTFTAKQYLQIDIASNFGLDKKDWNERLAWFAENEANLEELVPQADEPALFYAGMQAYRQMQKGQPIGYPISLDATASGMQILSCLTGDRAAANLCNVVDTEHRRDPYTIIYDIMTQRIGEASKISRADTKQAIMTSLYGSVAMPKQVFGDGMLYYTFLAVMGEQAPAVWELNQVMLDIWDPTVLSHDWIMPDNFHVHVKVMDQVREVVHFLNEPFEVSKRINRPVEGGRSLGANLTHSVDALVVREMTRRCMYHPPTINFVLGFLGEPTEKRLETKDDKMVKTLAKHYEDSGYLSARILDHINPENAGHIDQKAIWELLDSLPRKPFNILSIHDCFRCHPNYGNDLRRQYNLQLHLLARSKMLGYLLSQILNRPITTEKADPDLFKDVLEADYALS